jgi:flagellar biosynthesis protein FlhF
MHPAPLQRASDCYWAFSPAKLLFTRADGSESIGSAFCEAARLGKPLSFFSSGQLIPEDLEPASKEPIVANLVRELP